MQADQANVPKCKQPGYWKEYSMRRRRAKGIMPKTRMSDEERYRRHQERMKRYYERTKVLCPRVKLTPEEALRRRRACSRKWHLANRERLQKYRLEYKAKHPDIIRWYKLVNRARKASAVHPGHDKAREMSMIAEAQQLTATTGISYHVDHIIPIAAGGYHHHLNLQILPSAINLSKGDNPFWEMPGFKSWRDVPEFLWPERLAKQYSACAPIQSEAVA